MFTRHMKAGKAHLYPMQHRRYEFAAAWGLLLPLLVSLSCCPTAAAATVLSCPTNVITLDGAPTPTPINLQPNSSYELGAGTFILKLHS
jgi:hypothetical protein